MIELGAGTATKTRLLLDAAVRQQGSVEYYPIDISTSALEEARRRIGEEQPQVSCMPIVSDYTKDMSDVQKRRRAAAGAVHRVEHWKF